MWLGVVRWMERQLLLPCWASLAWSAISKALDLKKRDDVLPLSDGRFESCAHH